MQIIGETEVYKGSDPFVFVSYSHTDLRRIEGILRLLSVHGFRIWYDQMGDGIDAGMDWHAVIDERLQSSRAFLIFLGYGAQDRPEVMRELRMAVSRQSVNPEYFILPVFLDRIPLDDFPVEVRPFLMNSQNIGLWIYGGVTERFVKRIVYAGSWPDEVVDNGIRSKYGLQKWQPEGGKTEQFDFHPEEKGKYVFHYAVPEMAEKESEGRKIEYYKVNPGEVSPHAVYPFVMDNQWCPVSFYRDGRFRAEGFLCEELENQREKIQKQEICRGLLHARQLLVNRAFLQNSPIFIQWYTNTESEEYKAFCRLLDNGSILLVLYKEQMPCEETAYGNTNWEAWKRLCAEHRIYCLRMDWDDEQNNEMETDKRLSFPFHNYCVTTAENKYRIEQMIQSFSLSSDDSERMMRKWKQIQRDAIRTRERTAKGYSRSQFYIDHIIEGNTQVVECRISRRKRFACELKQIIDMRYNLNFTEAYGIKPMIPGDARLNPAVLDEMAGRFGGREVSAEELVYAAGAFHPEYFLGTVFIPETGELTLAQAEMTRNLPQWQRYIRLIEDADNRASQWDIDFSYIAAVWKAYQDWIKAVHGILPELGWRTCGGVLTIIYRIGVKEIRTVFRCGELKPLVMENDLPAVNRKQVLSIDYICGESEQSRMENCFLTEIRLFQGKTHETGVYLYNRLKERLSGGRKT